MSKNIIVRGAREHNLKNIVAFMFLESKAYTKTEQKKYS